jgi:hypothetical protein
MPHHGSHNTCSARDDNGLAGFRLAELEKADVRRHVTVSERAEIDGQRNGAGGRFREAVAVRQGEFVDT